jgi:hypothetical protein
VLLDSADSNEIFRDILIDQNANFESLYKAILLSYGFKGDQMASFYMSNDSWDKGYEISLFDMAFGEDADQILPGVMSNCTLSDYVKEDDQKMILVHDFFRMWIFLIELIGTTQDTPEYPQTVLSVGNAPAEESRSGDSNELNFETDMDFDPEDDDEFGFGDYEGDYEQFDDFDEY